jgi:hypothetical protein
MAEEIINEEIVPVETVTYGDPQPKPKNYVKKIHENLVEAFGVNEVPDEVTFTKKIKDPAYAKLIHENLVDAYGASEVPDFKTFSINFSTDPEKKNLGATGGTGSARSESKLPLQGFSQEQLNLLQKGVEPPKPSGKASIGNLNIPTNLPKQEVAAYERQLKTNEAAINTLSDIYKKKGLIFDPSKPAAQKQIQEYITKERDNDLTRVVGIKDGKQYLVRSEGFWESAGNALKRSITDPIESTNINMTNDANELADLLDEKIRKEPNIPEGAPSRFAGYLGELGGGLPKMMGLLAIPYVGEQAMVGEMYYNALANQRRFLYEKGLADGMDRVTSAENAMKNAPLTAIPDAVVAAAMARGVGGGGPKMIKGPAKESFLKAVGGGLKGVAKVSAIGGSAEFGRSKMQQAQGYDITDAEAIENGLRGAGDYAIMDAAFKLAHAGPKYISSAAKNLLSELPKEIVEVAAENYPDGKRTLEELPKFAETKAKVQDFVPEEKVAAVTGLTEKTDNLKADIIALEEKKKGVTSAIAKQIDLEIADKNKEINFYDNQIKKVLESKDPTGITEEVDDITGYKVDEEVKVKPSEAIGEFANRIAKGEKMESLEDLQFYENNKTEIEKALKAKAEETKPVVIMPEENIAPQIVEPSKGAAVIMPEENIAPEIIKTIGTEKVKQNKVKEEPLKENEYYHATDATEIITPSEKGYKKREGANVVGEGIYFGKDKEFLTDRYGKNAIKVELDIKNPLISDNAYIIVDGRKINVQSLSKEDIKFLKEKGYDAVQYKAPDKAYSKYDETIVFDKSQIKSQKLLNEEVKPTEVNVSPTVSEFKLGYAPFREGKITDISQADKAFENKTYQSFKKMASKFAQDIGLEVFSDPNVVGKYGATSELGEASSTPKVKGTDQQVELFAALIGTLAPEGQYSVMMNKYDVKGKDFEHVFTFANKEAAQDFYKNAGKYGVQDLSLTPDGNSVMFIASDKNGFDLINLTKDYGKQVTGHEENSINTRFLSQGEYSRILEQYGDKIGEQYPAESRQNILDAIQLAKERARRFGSDYGQKSEQAKIEAEKATQDYINKNKEELGLPDVEKTSVKKVDPELSKRVKDAYDALPVDDSSNPEVKAAYEKAAKEIDKQFEYLTKDLGIEVEFIKDDPYKNSDEMFEDIINNKRLKIFQGGEPHPFLGESTKDANGFTANEKLRAIHDYFGHFVGRNQFGKVGEEAAWVDHSKMFSPEAQRAITTETRGQNSWVNFSGVNDAAIAKMQEGNQLIKEGKVTEGNKLIKEGQSEFKFAEQKVALMPEEFSDWTKYSEKKKPLETAPKVVEPIVEEVKPSKTPKEIQISKKALGDNYNFSKEFDVRGGDVVATDVLTEVTKRAEKNGVDVPTQRAIEVGLMSKGTPEPTEYNIITAGSHLLNIDSKIIKAQETGNLAEVESLNEQRNEVLSVLRTLGNKAGRNLGLFNLVFQETDRSQVKLTRDYLKKVLKVAEVPETIAELDKSNLTAEQKKTVRPYVEKIEKAKANFEAIEKEVNKNISILNDQEINAALEKARAEGKKEGFQEGMKAATPEEKQKKSKQLKDLASQLRRSDELDKFLKGAGPLGGAEKAGVIDLGSYKEIVANVLDAVATAVELGENVTEAIKKAVEKFKDVDSARLISDVKTIMSKAQLPNKQEVMDKILKISKAENASDITKKISDKGLVKDIVNSYLGENLTNDQVLDAATKDLKTILPNVTREQVADAYAERGQFKKETKAKIENEINQKKADVKRLAVKEAKLKALEAADDYHLEETKEGKQKVRSEYEKEIDEKIKNLLNERKNAEKEQKVSKSPKTEQDKIDEINREIKFVKETQSVYEQAIKDPKKASEALLAAREERDKTYASLGLKLEKSAKSPILVERNYQNALAEIEKSGLPESEKNNKIAELKAQRDLDLQGTKQGVVSSLADDINNFVKSNIENENLNDSLKTILNDLTPSGEKLDDQINKAYNKLNKLAKDENLTKEERKSIETILTDLENNNQLTADELASKRLKKQWENEIRSAETDIASGNFTKVPSTTYDYRRNDELVRLNKARENKSGQLNRMIADAKEKNRTGFEKALDLSTKFLVSGIHTASKVLEAATFKPFMDSMVDLTAGRIASYMTGSPYVSLYSVKKGYKTFAAFKNKEEAQKNIQKLQNKRDVALENLKDAYENGGDVKKAEKEFKNADLEYAVSTLYNSIESNVVNSFWQYLKHGATDYDVNIGKSSKKDISEYRTILGKTGYVLDGWIRMHSAMKSSLSARPEMMKVFSSTLKDFQRKGMELSPENISTAMVLAADAYEAGRLTNKTALSKIISRGKGSEKSAAMRYITKGLMPVSTIAVNLAKRGVDYASLGAEGFTRLATETKKGMRLNEVEGKTYDTLIKAIKDGWNRIPLKERVYINGVIGRGLFGSAIMLATAYGLKNGMVKYGGTFEDQRKRKVMGSDDEQLKAGEWEFFGTRMPKAASLFLNHLPEFLAVSLIADNYQISQMGGTGGEKFETTIDEIEARLPFQTMAGLFVPGRRVNTIVDRFTRIPIAAEAATLFDEKAEFRDKSDFINRIRGNVGFGIVNPTKEQQKQINEIMKQIRKLPAGTLTLEDEKAIDAIIEDIKNTDFGELEMKKAMEESKKE